jgi:hypothetical protein
MSLNSKFKAGRPDECVEKLPKFWPNLFFVTILGFQFGIEIEQKSWATYFCNLKKPNLRKIAQSSHPVSEVMN